MKTPFLCFTGLILSSLLPCANAALPPSGKVRTISDINIISTQAFKRSVSPKFYRSLLVSPLQGWVAVRGNLIGTRMTSLKVVHSELDGRYDAMALQLAKDIQISGYYSIERPRFGGSCLLHLLIYQIADGTMALSFPQITEPGGEQMQYFGCARLAVLKKDGNWTEIKGPDGLQNKGWSVRQGMRSELGAITKMEMKAPNVGW